METSRTYCPFNNHTNCLKDYCELFIKEYECCAFKYQVVKDIQKAKEDVELRAKFREIFNRRDR